MMVSKNGFYTFVYGTRIGDADPPAFLKTRSSNTFIIATIAIAIFTDIFLYSLVVPVLPFALKVRAGVEEKDLQRWTSIFLAVYGAALAIGSPLFGWFADRSSSRRAPLLLGLLAIGGATAMLCAGSSLGILLAGRFLQGLSASVVWTVGLALLSDTIEKERIGQAMGYIATSTSLGSLAGPLLGGVIYADAGYYAVFAVGFGIIGLDIVLRLLMIERSVAQQWDLPAVETSESTSENKKETVQNGDLDAIEAIPRAELSDSEKLAIKPLPAWLQRMPPFITLLRIPRILVALFGCFYVSAALAAFDSSLPLYVKNTFSWNSTGAGLIFICLVVPALVSPVAGYVSDKYGSRIITAVGLLGSVPFWVLLRFVTHNTLQQKVLLCALLFLIGLCMTFIMAPLMADIDHAVAQEEKKRPGSLGKRGAAAQGFGLFNFAYALGTLIGPLWAGFVVEDAGWGTMVWSLGLLSGVAAITSFFFTGGRIMLSGKGGEGAV